MQRPVFDLKNSICKIVGLKIQMAKACSTASSTSTNNFLKKILESQFFCGISKTHLWAGLGKFGLSWAVSGSTGHILLH
jgi:hypothetical protein